MKTSLFQQSGVHLILALFAGSMLINSPAFSQKTEDQPYEVQTLFGQSISYGGYGGLSIGFTSLAGHDAITSGGRGVFLIGHSLGVGLAGTGFVADLSNYGSDNYWSYMGGGYGGLLIEPILFGLRPIHLAFPVVIGAGAITIDGNNSDYSYYSSSYYPYNYPRSIDEFVMLEPGVEVEMNITRFFRLAIGGSYRLTSKVSVSDYEWSPISATPTLVETPVIENKNLNNFNLNISFKFGKF